ncbi:MAG: hypothetical protein AAF846_01385 [Chloroflexota bacterium]
MASKRLKWDDMISPEQANVERQNYTDEDARKLGYPNVEVLHLADSLSALAGKWRRTKDAVLVHEYKSTLYEMILKGYDVNTLPVQDQLPDDLMPDLPSEPVQRAIKTVYESQ